VENLSIKKLIGVIGSGLIGRDPFDEKSWSGSSKYFFDMCAKFGILERAIGVEAPLYLKLPLMLKNFSFDIGLWRQIFYLDIRYYKALTKAICKRLRSDDFFSNIIQIGGIYNVPECVKGKNKCYSYHDGNLAQALKSPYMPKTIPRSTINKALDYERNVYHNMDKIFTMSEYLRRSFIEDFDVHEDKVKTIGAGINLDEIPDVREKDYEKKNILFIGVDFYRKGGIQLLKAFRIVKEAFPKAELHIIGPKKLEIDHRLGSGIKFHGFLSKKDPKQRQLFDSIMRDSSIFAMPSLYEPFGIAPLEAMVYEIPCILTNDWAFPEMVQPGVNGELVECGNVNELADKIKFLLGNPDLLHFLGKNARNIVLTNYTWDIVVKRLIKGIS
jgi:starch synthase